jgi:hypothetical protein
MYNVFAIVSRRHAFIGAQHGHIYDSRVWNVYGTKLDIRIQSVNCGSSRRWRRWRSRLNKPRSFILVRRWRRRFS